MTNKSNPTIPKKSSRFRRILSLFVFYCIFLGIIWWSEPLSQKDFILFTVLLIGSGVFFEILEKFKWYQDLPLLFQRLIFYGVIIPISSIVVPILDILIMSAGSIVFELGAIFKNEELQEKP